MTNNCKIDFMTQRIVITNSFYKNAQFYGTPEFNMLLDLQNKLPSFHIELQYHSPRKSNVWYPTYSQMEELILRTSNDEASVRELQEIIELARVTHKGYNMVRRWFMNRYGDTRELVEDDYHGYMAA